MANDEAHYGSCEGLTSFRCQVCTLSCLFRASGIVGETLLAVESPTAQGGV